ncbi:peptidoglycan-associated lipoprotein [Sulfuriferula sp. AH1]|uniref:peptidoglycan-associated lipoprotein Pal n=1 Tax=Sulfuriferula sp. AH1 TaxID=1985873 RepID=UPI000B3B5937|nr:peptidoglycan-associated lipoprotein Pal [Sulfuriferula sp. AH1]ARU32045.1 peptidoglycan-associated lipoprotein [Sulfuriferula sp. AH1]
MKKTVLGLVIVGMLAGCSSVGTKPAPVVDTSAQDAAAKAAAEKAAADKAAAEAAALERARLASQANPLKDPSNILSQRSVYFDFDKYNVKDDFRPMIEAHAAYLTSHKDAKVTLQGNTDDRGSREYNLALGQRRADSVRKALNLLNVPESQMEAVSFGEEKPKATGEDEAAWSQNRRTDIVYQGE